MNKKLIMFDLDGTLVNSMGCFADLAATIMSQEYGFSFEKAREAYCQTSGLPFPYQLEKIFPHHPKNEGSAIRFAADKISIYDSCPFFSDVLPAMILLKSKGFDVVVSSNNDQDIVDQKLKQLPFWFDLALGYKPGFLKGLQHLKVVQRVYGVKSQPIFVGDSLHDAVMAQELKLPFIARTGTFTADDFKKQNIAFGAVSDFFMLSQSIVKLHVPHHLAQPFSAFS